MTTKTATAKSAKAVIETVKGSAEAIQSDALQRFPIAATPGDGFRQGDIYGELLGAVPPDAKVVEDPQLQLAPGTTQGSRHCLDSFDGVTVYERSNANALDGPILDLAEERTIEHPEHGDIALPPGIYGITYQRAMGKELRRAQD